MVYAKVEWPSAPGISSDGGIIMDADTGTVLYSKNINTEMYPASITKLMTVLLVLENCTLDQTLTFSKNAVYNIEFGSNHIGMSVGEQITVEEALYGILLESANEVSNGVGELIAGDQDKFVEMMNKRAQELGCKHTHFMNANGLHDKQHYSSPYDMALIARECL
ncbi:MAG: D-alanyl-D-alanine carboxypeptidase, partial [Lachnospiraceae bacterium]|nr:D-alanyl-D-alanine carboxypeptidase [Lachnospiraceae bacterium]